jgi:hypothetical protein
MMIITALSGLILLTPSLTRNHDLPEQVKHHEKPTAGA